MNLERFLYLLDAYGADLRLWPEADCKPAQALLATSADAAKAQREALRLDAVLQRLEPIVSPGSVERVLAAVARPAPQPDDGLYAAVVAGAGRRWIPPAVLGFMAVLGFVVGLADIERGTSSDLVATVFSTDLAGTLGL
jgi:hypothetical protein